MAAAVVPRGRGALRRHGHRRGATRWRADGWRALSGDSLVGRVVELDVGPVAHGGHCVARHEGRVVFVRHTLPGERVRVRITEGEDDDRFLRGDAVEVLSASPDRVERRCPVSGPGGCGGCDWQHVSTAGQRALKADVVREQLRRLAHLDVEVEVERVVGDEDGLGWRTRVQHAVAPDGHLGLRRHRSHDVVPIVTCPIAHPRVRDVELAAPEWRGARSVEVVAPAGGDGPLVLVEPLGKRRPRLPVVEGASVAVTGAEGVQRVRGRTWVSERVEVGDWRADLRVSGSGFWQVHPGAPAALVAAVLDGLDPQPGEQVLDLYAGVGLFAAALGDRVGPDGAVLAVEGSAGAVRDARRNLHAQQHVGITAGRVDDVLDAALRQGLTADLVVLDPPRTGAGRVVVEQVSALGPRAVAYVACDPAALARDLATFAGLGLELRSLRGFDCFPMTMHVECVAILGPAG